MSNRHKTPEDRARELGVPLIRRRLPVDVTTDPNPVVAVCGECGIAINKIMHFSCQNHNCPCQAKITY